MAGQAYSSVVCAFQSVLQHVYWYFGIFCSMRTAVPPLGPQHRVPETVPSLETHLKSEYVKGRPNGWRYVGRKEETRSKSDGRKSEWKTSSMEGEGKGDGHQYGRKPRTPEPIPIAGNSPSEEEMGHRTPTGVEPKDYDDDDDDDDDDDHTEQ